MPLSPKEILDKTRRLQARYRETEQRWMDAKAAREGNLDQVFPDVVSEAWPKPIVANFIDTVARDLAEIVAPLPAFNCSSATMSSDTARKFADRRSKIVQHYVAHSSVEVQMQTAADHYFTYGYAVAYIEPDSEARLPRTVFESPLGGYCEWDRWGRIVTYTKRFWGEVEELQAAYPEFEKELAKAAQNLGVPGHNCIELIRYCSRDQITLIAVTQQPVKLIDVKNRLGEVPVAIAKRPWLDPEKPKGQFDDVIWVQIARDTLAKLNLEATEKAVQAPLALPADVQEINTGPDAILRTQFPEKIRRVGMEISPAGFTQSQLLLQEMRDGTRYPEARTGGVDASIVTGRGVQALMGGFDTQIKAAQLAFKAAFTDIVRLSLKMDEKFWPNTRKGVRGQANGVPYDFEYTPAKDINGDYSVDVSYGFAAGLDPNRAVVMLLQLRAEKAFSRDYFIRQLPFEINVGDEMRKVDVEETREAIKQGVFAYVQSIPAMAQSGMDPGDAVLKLTQIVSGLQKGKPIEVVVSEAFAPQPPSPTEPAPPGGLEGGPPGGPGAGAGAAGGLTESGLMRGVSPGQAGQAPGGRPDLSVMLAGLTGSGNPVMSSTVMRRRRV